MVPLCLQSAALKDGRRETRSKIMTSSKIYVFYNKGMCSNEGSHDIYKHICSFCVKSGKSLGHLESKCVNKQRGNQGHNNAS